MFFLREKQAKQQQQQCLHSGVDCLEGEYFRGNC